MVFGVSPFTKRADPRRSSVEVLFRRSPRDARRLVGRLVKATGRGPAKKDLNTQRAAVAYFERSEQTISDFGAAPLGDGRGASSGEWVGALG